MAGTIAGLPFWELAFDEDGDPDGGQRDAFLTEVRDRRLTDIVLFAHGWGNDRAMANRLFTRIFELLAPQVPATARTTLGLAGVSWPARLWPDEPIPDFLADGGSDGGAVSLGRAAAGAPADPTLDAATLSDLHALFPKATAPLDEMARLLRGAPTPEAQKEFHRLLGEFSRLAGARGERDDGEGDAAGAALAPGEPRMLLDDPHELFTRYRTALRASGVPAADDDGAAASGDGLDGLLNGMKEALRQASYWQMKIRAGTVGRAGLGPVLGQLPPGVRVHLVGHSFGARLISFALAGLPPGPSPVRAVTLLQGAFSHFAFASPLPFDAARSGALAGLPARINGPLVACFTEHDSALGRFYPLASFAAQDDSAAAQNPSSRWGAIGANGAQGVHAPVVAIRPAGARYEFVPGGVLNIDASEVVRNGPPPSGAHSDILHPEVPWLVLAAGGLVTP